MSGCSDAMLYCIVCMPCEYGPSVGWTPLRASGRLGSTVQLGDDMSPSEAME
jgi:hypothetical protein